MSEYEFSIETLDNICLKITDGSHFSPKGIDSGYPMMSVKDMGEYDFCYDDCKFISESDYISMVNNDCIPQINDILIAKDGNSSLDHIFIVRKKCDVAILSSIAIIRPDSKKICPEYLCYVLKNPVFNNSMKDNIRSGSAIPRVVLRDFKKIEIPLPPLETQKRIADILSSLDKKIELNNHINKVLEEIAQTLFKHWFVDFEFPNEEGKPYKSSSGKMVESEMGEIPEGWGVGELKEISNITMGQSPDGTSYNEDGNGTVFYQGRGEFGNRFPTRRLFTTEPSRMADNGDVLISVRAPVGDLNIAVEKCCIGRGLGAVQSKNRQQSFLFYTLKMLKKDFDVFNGEGTVFGSINKESLNSMKIIIPESVIANSFEKKVSILDKQMRTNFNEIVNLSTMRDILLPKLMKGEIEIER